MRSFFALAGMVLSGLLVSGGTAAPVMFSRDVLPVLSDRCFQCHGPDAKAGRKGDLRLDDENDAKRSRDGRRVIWEKDPSASELIRRITTADPDDRMPPDQGKALSTVQVETLKQWIREGAKWGSHWSFERVERPVVDQVAGHPIDVLVARVLAAAGVQANGAATRETLIRRASLDLTGLPPTPAEVDAFLQDRRADAWERLLDRLLASPAFGERMAWDWLEAARYADSNGYQGDSERTMWPWRDWVVRAFNDNLPHDRFTIWQLAGDLLPDATQDQILATGFCRNHMINGEGGRIAEENRVDYVLDMTETMGTVWLALTLNCSRCHDHKFDPVTQREYYQLTAFFNQTPVDGKGRNPQTPPVLESPTREQAADLAAARSKEKEITAAIQSRNRELDARQTAWEASLLAAAAKDAGSAWMRLAPLKANAKNQSLRIEKDGGVLAEGELPEHDEYVVEYGLAEGSISGIRLDATRHKAMPKGGLSRNDAGNFVLTDFKLELLSDSGAARSLEIADAVATFEQGGLTVARSFDDDPKSGWGVWDKRPVDRDHAAVYRLKEPVVVTKGGRLRVTLKFNSGAKFHVLGHFMVSATGAVKPDLEGVDGEVLALLEIPPDKRSEKQRARLRDVHRGGDQELAALNGRKKAADAKVKKIQSAIAKVMVMRDMEKPRQTFMLERGLYNQPGEVVPAGVPASLPKPAGATTNRLDLAQWLVSRDHPLTSRVAVNRFWQMLFGIGLVKTAEDFGVQGEYPVQRELLDWLAAEFMESRWDVKGLLRTIMTSETYRRSSVIASAADHERDPENRLLARGARFRMPAWMLRDQALAASGLLNPAIGGEPVFSYQPTGIWAEATFGKKKYEQSKGDALYRRSLYTFWRRIVGPTVFFDSAKRQVCEVKPLRTNTPMHALTTLNDVTYVEAARVLAEKVIHCGEDDHARLQAAVRRVLARELTAEEEDVWLHSLQRALQRFADAPDAAAKLVQQGDSAADKTVPVEKLAAWTAICLNLLNLDETLNKE
jgi:hypothetical protein